jgi:hypothetical protein
MAAPFPLPEWARHPEPLRRGPVVGEAVRLLVAGWRVLLTDPRKRALFLPGRQEHGHHDATGDLEELEARVLAAGDRIATAGVAVLVGGASEPFAVDLDGPCAVQWAEATLGERLAQIPHERTSKGLHVFFAPTPEIRRQVRWEPEGWECTCGSGCGIDLLGHLAEDEDKPPSQRRPAQALVVAPSPGRSWVGPGTGLPRPEALPPLPPGWIEQSPRPKREAAPVQIITLPEGVAGTEAGLRALERACKKMAAAPPGQRHDTLVRLGLLVGGWVGAGHLEPEFAAARLAAARPEATNPADDLATARWAIEHGAEAPLDPSDPGPGRGPGGGGGKVRRLPRETVVLPSSPVPATTIDEARAVLQAEVAGQVVERGLLVNATVGVGKTTTLLPALLATEIEAGGSAVVATPTKDLVDQSVAALKEKCIEAFAHYGRHSLLEDLRPEGSCAAKNIVSELLDDDEPSLPGGGYSNELRKYAERRVVTIHEVSVKRHPIYQRACQSCIMGRKTTLEHSRELHSPERAKVRLEKSGALREDLERLGISYGEVPVCEYITQRLRESGNFIDEDGNTPPAPKTIVAAHPAVSPDLLRAVGGTKKVRLLAADETWALTEQVTVGPDDVARWQAVLGAWRGEVEQGLLGLLASTAADEAAWPSEDEDAARLAQLMKRRSGQHLSDEAEQEVAAIRERRRQRRLHKRSIDERRRLIEQVQAVGTALAGFGRVLAEPPEAFEPEQVLAAWQEVAAAAAALVTTGKPRATTAPWEEISYLRNIDGELERLVPLRAIADCLEFAIPRKEVGAVRVSPPSSDGAARLRFLAAAPATHILLGVWSKEYRWALFDATTPWAVRRLAEAHAEAGKGVRVVSAPARVGVVKVHPSRTFGRGRYRGLESGDPRQEARAAMVLRQDVGFIERRLREFLAEHPGKPVSILGHKPVIERLEKRLREDDELGRLLSAEAVKLGWFGRDDRGSNRFAGGNLLIFGVPIPPPYALRAAWDEVRALLHGVVELPEWDDERLRAIRRLADGTEVPMGVLVPSDAEIRAWWDHTLSAAVAQIAGRARPADNPEAEVHLWSGFVPDLGEFGFDVQVEADDEPTAVEDANNLRHLRSLERVAVAAAALADAGRRVSVRAIQRWCRERGLEAPRNRNVLLWLEQLRAEGRAPNDPEVLAGLLAELEKVAERVAVEATPEEVAQAMAEAATEAAEQGRSSGIVQALGWLAGHAHSVAIGLAEWVVVEDEPPSGEVVARAGP